MELASYADSVRLASISKNKDSDTYRLYKHPSNFTYIQKQQYGIRSKLQQKSGMTDQSKKNTMTVVDTSTNIASHHPTKGSLPPISLKREKQPVLVTIPTTTGRY